MARPTKPADEKRKPRSVSLRPQDWKYLESLAANIAFNRESTSATTSEAVRLLIAQDQTRRGTYLPVEGQKKPFVFLQTGATAAGEEIHLRFAPDTGEVETVIRTKGAKIGMVYDRAMSKPPRVRRR